MDDCLFCRIVGGTIPGDFVYRDQQVSAFNDIQPQAPVHVLLVPNRHITSMNDLEEDDQETVGYLMRMVRVVARGQGIAESGYRVVVNMGQDAMMTVPHLHVHILGGRKLGWPPG
ncbi:MAG TPA: histidine triad nucleotide-binding protein [Chloroflexota bacterium]|nr:histidine triad nucleotide-binding protein [Chloroflexota bacterium]